MDRCAGEVRGLAQIAMPGEVGRRCAGDPARDTEPSRDQPPVANRAEAQRAIHLLLEQIDDPVVEAHFERYPRGSDA